MRGVIAKQPGGPEELAFVELDEPLLQKGEILIDVQATAVNRTDILNREGKSGYARIQLSGLKLPEL